MVDIWAGSRPSNKPGRQQLSERVAMYLREAIMAGEMQTDSFIRTEALAENLDVSATPVREALMILHSEGTVQWEPRRGFRVPALTRSDVEDLFMVQSWIAGELARRACKVMTVADMDTLDSFQQKLESAADNGDVQAVDSFNHQIHRAINKASDSERLASVLNSTVNYVPLRYFQQIPGWVEASVHDHAPIFTALRAKSPAKAQDAMAEHVWHIGNLLVEHLASLGRLDPAASS